MLSSQALLRFSLVSVHENKQLRRRLRGGWLETLVAGDEPRFGEHKVVWGKDKWSSENFNALCDSVTVEFISIFLASCSTFTAEASIGAKREGRGKWKQAETAD